MASLVDILCAEHSEPHAYYVEDRAQNQKSDSIRSKAHDEQMKEMNPGKSPFPTEGGRRKSGWGKRFKEREQGRLAVIFPRRKLGEAARGSDAVWLSVEVLNSLADRSLASAAKILVRCYLKSIACS